MPPDAKCMHMDMVLMSIISPAHLLILVLDVCHIAFNFCILQDHVSDITISSVCVNTMLQQPSLGVW
jgi:hypothetical protein